MIDINETIDTLRSLEVGYYPQELFEQFARLSTLAYVEIVPFVRVENELKIVLIQRPSDDKFWPSMYHIPGCCVRPTDDIQTAMDRIIYGELQGQLKDDYIGFSTFRLNNSARGNELALIFKAELSDFKVGELFDPHELPSNLIEYHRQPINYALPIK